MSFFDRQGIPESLLKPSKDAQRLGEDGESACEELGDSESEDSAGEPEDAFEDDVAMLRDYCLVSA